MILAGIEEGMDAAKEFCDHERGNGVLIPGPELKKMQNKLKDFETALVKISPNVDMVNWDSAEIASEVLLRHGVKPK